MFVYLLAMILYNFTVCTNIIVTTYMTQNITLVWLVLGSVLQTVTYYTFLITFFFKSNAVKLFNYSPEEKKNSLYSINLNLLHEILLFTAFSLEIDEPRISVSSFSSSETSGPALHHLCRLHFFCSQCIF